MQTKPLSALKQGSTALLDSLDSSPLPVLLTRSGRPAAYLVGVAAFDALSQRLALLEGIARGERAIEEGRVLSHAKAKKRMARWLN